MMSHRSGLPPHQSQHMFVFATETIQREKERERNEVRKCIDCHIRFSWIASQDHCEWGIESFDPIAPDPHISFIICPWWKQFRVHCSNIAKSLSAYWLSLVCCLPTAIFNAFYIFFFMFTACPYDADATFSYCEW